MHPARPARPWQLRLLGGFGLERDGQRLTRLPSRAALLLLARLALQPGRDHGREELADWLWPTADAATGRARLRQTLSVLRAALERGEAVPGQVIEADRSALRLVAGALVCDAWDFEQAARRGDLAAAAAAHGGDLLPGHYDPWIHEERLRLRALAERAGLDPDRPTARASAPHPDARDDPAAAQRKPAQARGRHDALPRYLTRWVGGPRGPEALAAEAAASPLVVVRGAGGLGKTRLAVEAARRLLDDGVVDTACFVAWAGCVTAGQAAQRLRLALALAPDARDDDGAASTADAVAVVLAGREALLVLDNAEQLTSEALALVPALLRRLPALRVVLTTRRSIDLPGAREWLPAPLPAGAPGAPAVELFVERARDARPDFRLHEGNAAAVSEVVERLGGLPLAIELAAARVRTLPPARLATLLRSAGASRWHGLARRGAAAVDTARHASIRAVVDASVGLLTPRARALLRRLACVPADCCGALAELAATADGLATAEQARSALDELAGDSLLAPAADEDLDRWWALPEPVRDLVLEDVGAAERAASNAAWRAALRAWAPTLAPEWPLDRVALVLPLLLAVLDEAASPPAEEVLELMLAFAPAWQERSPPAGALAALQSALAQAEVDADADAAGRAGPPREDAGREAPDRRRPPPRDRGADLRPRAHALAAALDLVAGQRDRARVHAAAVEAALPAAPQARAQALLVLARVAWRADADATRARRHLADARALAADAPGLAAALLSFEATLANEADRDAAAAGRAYRQALRLLAAEPGAHGHVRRGLRYNLAITDVYAGRAAPALQELRALADEARAAGDRHLLAQALNARGSALDLLGRPDDAEAATRESLAEAWAALETENALYALWNLGPLALARGDAERAARLMAFADRFWRTHFGALSPSDARDVARTRRRCRRRLGRVDGQRCWNEGAALPLAAAVALALGRA
ncbi:MAG: hypothetical protein MUF03_00740 [Rubrivivax sp.]|jgi:predicted ATPase|nr:hypothetical protein [Rubrivivax sp.]